MTGCKKQRINPDLQKERNTASFDREALTHVINGGKEKTDKKHEIERILFSDSIFLPWQRPFNSRYENYEMGLQKAIKVMEMAAKHNWSRDDLEIAFRAFKYDMPVGVHCIMFVPALERLCNETQRNKWLPLARSLQIIGTYAQTELGHGTNLRKLETTARYDVAREEFVINTPSLTAMKFWPGGLGKSANHVLLLAQLEIGGEKKGLQAFLVPIRSLTDHMPLPGVEVGDIGPKIGVNTADNGYLILRDVRIPRENMLARHAEVTQDGRLLKKGGDAALYGTMVMVRAIIVDWSFLFASHAAVIATRYSAVRRQTEPNPSEGEVQVLDFQTQQLKVFPAIALAYALLFARDNIISTYQQIYEHQLQHGNFSAIPELHSQSCCLKALATELSTDAVESCRRSCGGHGYLLHSGIADTYLDSLGSVTFEGENTVLYQQTARFLLKNLMSAMSGEAVAESCAYLTSKQTPGTLTSPSDLCDPSLLTNVMNTCAQRMLTSVAKQLQSEIVAGHPQYEAWNLHQQQAVDAARAHADAYIASNFVRSVQQRDMGPSERNILAQLSIFHMLYRIISNAGAFLETKTLSPDQVGQIRDTMLRMLPHIRKEAVSLVDAFDMRDEAVNSTIGSFDGNAYERLYAMTKNNPMNKFQVHPAVVKYLQPFQKRNIKANL